jgi:hypothetical protein
MLKRFVFAAVIGFSASGVAFADPTSADDCFQMSMDLFKTADAKQLAPADRGKIEELLEKMETHCDAKQFSDAQSVANSVKAIIK